MIPAPSSFCWLDFQNYFLRAACGTERESCGRASFFLPRRSMHTPSYPIRTRPATFPGGFEIKSRERLLSVEFEFFFVCVLVGCQPSWACIPQIEVTAAGYLLVPH
mmetsp:Transcript_49608/g.108351  ORF Transcript_49608/g.108351 Transcript_49608/m.108351 type:complete len:106 (+) Transcript_49608:346-663(+)